MSESMRSDIGFYEHLSRFLLSDVFELELAGKPKGLLCSCLLDVADNYVENICGSDASRANWGDFIGIYYSVLRCLLAEGYWGEGRTVMPFEEGERYPLLTSTFFWFQSDVCMAVVLQQRHKVFECMRKLVELDLKPPRTLQVILAGCLVSDYADLVLNEYHEHFVTFNGKFRSVSLKNRAEILAKMESDVGGALWNGSVNFPWAKFDFFMSMAFVGVAIGGWWVSSVPVTLLGATAFTVNRVSDVIRRGVVALTVKKSIRECYDNVGKLLFEGEESARFIEFGHALKAVDEGRVAGVCFSSHFTAFLTHAGPEVRILPEVLDFSGDHDWSLDEVMELVREESRVLGQTVACDSF